MTNIFKLSVSKTSTFKTCKAKYKFSYVLKLPRKDFEYHIFGRFAHRVLELFHQEYINGSTENYNKVMSDCFNASLQEFKGKISLTQKDEAFNLISQYLDRVNKHKEEVAQVISVEKTFNIQMNDGLILTGMIDRIQLDADGIYHIADYKTSKSKKYLEKDLLQLLTYAYVIYNEHPEIKKVRVSYIMLKFNSEFITKEFDLEQILSIKDVYEKYAEDIHREADFKANPGPLCEYCEFVDMCEPGLATLEKKYKVGQTKW